MIYSMEDSNKSNKRNKISSWEQHFSRLNPRIKRTNRHGLPHETGLKIAASKNKLVSITANLKHKTNKRKRRVIQSNFVAMSIPQKDPTGWIQSIQSGRLCCGHDHARMQFIEESLGFLWLWTFFYQEQGDFYRALLN